MGRLKMEIWGQAIPSSLRVWGHAAHISILRVICTKATLPAPSCRLSDAQHNSSSLIPDPRIINRKEKRAGEVPPILKANPGKLPLKKKKNQTSKQNSGFLQTTQPISSIAFWGLSEALHEYDDGSHLQHLRSRDPSGAPGSWMWLRPTWEPNAPSQDRDLL